MMSESAFETFCKDVKDAGRFHERGKRLNGKILDGRHRHLASVVTGIPLKFDEFDPARDGEPWNFVVSRMARQDRLAEDKVVEVVLLAERAPRAKKGEGEALERIAERAGISLTYAKAGRACRNSDLATWRKLVERKIKITEVINRQRHVKARERVAKLKARANLTIADCDLRLGDNVKLMRRIDGGSLRCIFADPQYNQGWAYRADPTGDQLPRDEYLKQTVLWMAECARLLTPDGTLYVLINDANTDDYGQLLRSLGLVRQPTIVWWETFSNYRSAEAGPTCVTRYIHRYARSDKPFFNAIELRDPSYRDANNDKRKSGIGKVPDNVWPIARVTGTSDERVPWANADDAPQLPVLVPERCILMSSEAGDTVLDPFNGNGITGIAALRNGRRYVGLDRDKQGLEQARAWIAHSLAPAKP